MADHRVFGRIIAPGALYGAMAAALCSTNGSGPIVVENMQFHNALVFPKEHAEDANTENTGRRVQVLLPGAAEGSSNRVQLLSKGAGEEQWTLHAEWRAPSGKRRAPEAPVSIVLEDLKKGLSPQDIPAYYRAKASVGISLGPQFRTLRMIWSRAGEALGEIALPEGVSHGGLSVHPLLLDGCFQVVGATRNPDAADKESTYLPFCWERLWLADRLPARLFCHVHLKSREGSAESQDAPEVFAADARLYDERGVLIGRLTGYTIKRATRATLLSATEGINELLYEVVWRECALPQGLEPAGFFPGPAAAKARSKPFSGYLSDEGVKPEDREALLADLERWSWSYALANLDRLGWQCRIGDTVVVEDLRQQLNVDSVHRHLFRRMLEMAAKAGVLEEIGDGFTVLLGSADPWPQGLPEDPERFADRMAERYSHGSTEIGLFRRCGSALVDVLRGRADSLTLLFGSGEPTAADLFVRAPVARAANMMLGEAVRTLLAALPAGRRLRVIEVGAGTGSATASVLPELPDGRFEYMYTDISAGFFAEAEARFGDRGGAIEYRPLNIEKDPIDQGFDAHRYDLMIASNVLHATRYLDETLAHCRKLLAPSGHLVALENLRGQGWMDLTFGGLDGWWRFADDCRPHHAMAGSPVWRQVLDNTGFEEVEFLGIDESDSTSLLVKSVIVAKGPTEVKEAPGLWVLAAGKDGVAANLAEQLSARNQTVILAADRNILQEGSSATAGTGILRTAAVEADRRESWLALLKSLPRDVPFGGVVHLVGLDGHGAQATVDEMADDVQAAVASALALVQAVADSDRIPMKGTWFLTRGAQILERELGGELSGAALWGFGKAVAREAAQLQPRMIDIDPRPTMPVPDLVNELLYPDAEDHIVYRSGRRQVARLIRVGEEPGRLTLPDESEWVLAPDPAGAVDRPHVQPLPRRPLEPKEVRVGVDAASLNFWDVFRSLGFIREGLLGREVCGRILETGTDVSSVEVGDRVVGLGFGAFGAEMITRGELVVCAPANFSTTELATMPLAFVSAALSFELSGLEAGDRVLIHAGAGGVGLAAIQLVQAAGAEVFATASAPKQAYLRSLGVRHVFNSRTTDFGAEILEATGGAGVDVVLNSLTSEGYIDASLSCLKQGGRFVELARRDILSEEAMAATRPDVSYAILDLDALKKTEPAWVGRVLNDVVALLAAGELKPIVHSRWPLAEAGAALRFMRSARHLGKIVVTAPPLTGGRLRPGRTYLVTGGLGGIGCAMAEWLADHGAETIVLNGRRDPDAEAEKTIRTLREGGMKVHVELADVTDAAAMDRMLARIDQELPPLGGVIHSVGVLSDGALTNQSWNRFEKVLWPKILGAWHLHRATEDRDLDFFMLFSSRVGVMGNPGQTNHAAANAFLDQLAGHRRAIGLPGQSIAWGAWSEIGEAAERREHIEEHFAARGVRWITPQQGLEVLDRLMRQDLLSGVVTAVDWSVFRQTPASQPSLLKELLSVVPSDAEESPLADDLISRLQGTPDTERQELLVSFLQQEAQAVLRLPSLPAPSVGFFDLGMDSLMAVEFRNRLNRTFAGAYVVPNTVVFDHPDIVNLARHLSGALEEIDAHPAPDRQAEPARASVSDRDGNEIAVVGMACRFPGAPDLAAYWRLLESGLDAVTDARRDAGPWRDVVGDPEAEDPLLRRGGFIESLDCFDAQFFGIRPIEARTMDPCQRERQCCWKQPGWHWKMRGSIRRCSEVRAPGSTPGWLLANTGT